MRIFALLLFVVQAFGEFDFLERDYSEPFMLQAQGDSCTPPESCGSKYYVCKTPERGDRCKDDIGPCCLHKGVFNPQIYPIEIAGTFVFTVMMALCQVGGIGGGGIDEPMNMAFYKFNTKQAVALSSFIILICTIVRTIYTWRTKDPEKPYRIVTDYGLAVVMMASSLAGSQIGAIVLHTCPAIVI
jgi:hypothetical protein